MHKAQINDGCDLGCWLHGRHCTTDEWPTSKLNAWLHRRFRDANPEEIEALTLDAMREAVDAQLQPGNVEISLVGDIDMGQVDAALLRYLGTVAARPEAARQLPPARPPVICYPPPHLRRQAWHLKVSRDLAPQAVVAAQHPVNKGQRNFTCPDVPI